MKWIIKGTKDGERVEVVSSDDADPVEWAIAQGIEVEDFDPVDPTPDNENPIVQVEAVHRTESNARPGCIHCGSNLFVGEVATVWSYGILCKRCSTIQRQLRRGMKFVAVVPCINGMIVIASAVAFVGALIAGERWTHAWLLPAGLLILVNCCLLLPLSILLTCFSGFRSIGWIGLVCFGRILLFSMWIVCLHDLMIAWGRAGIIVGMLLMGVGVIGIDFVRSIFAAEWATLATIAVVSVIGFGCSTYFSTRIGMLAERSDGLLMENNVAT